ncbi:hypothetical protein T08_9534 [Trichinella sp. T8]|nr:hypothetical protein T08_9534 [Trichinella sp. T8]
MLKSSIFCLVVAAVPLALYHVENHSHPLVLLASST